VFSGDGCCFGGDYVAYFEGGRYLRFEEVTWI
jgi:hypothetical protein